MACVLLAVGSARAGADSGSAGDFVRSFLEEYPRFKAEGVMTSTLAGRPPYRCRVEMAFDKTDSVLFEYNTDGAKNIIPYDYAYADHKLRETIYNRDRSQVKSQTEIGAPTRTVFNFVWDLLYEAEHGAGFNSFLFNGLMSIKRDDPPKGTVITLQRRIPAGPVEKVVFTFDDERRLKRLEIKQGDGSGHRIDIRRFRANAVDKESKEAPDNPKDDDDKTPPTPPRH